MKRGILLVLLLTISGCSTMTRKSEIRVIQYGDLCYMEIEGASASQNNDETWNMKACQLDMGRHGGRTPPPGN